MRAIMSAKGALLLKEYQPRLIDPIIEKELEAFGAILLNGPKWCGKTTTAKQKAKSILYMQDPDQQDAFLQLADAQPSALLQGDHPRLIDEWQMAPQLWDAIRHDVDQKGEEGLYILTGSTSVDEDKIQHSGAGRISRLKMYTLSLFETHHSNGRISLGSLFDQKAVDPAQCDLKLKDYAALIIRGGWPNSLGKSDEVARRQVAGYCDTIIRSDISTVDGVSRNEERARTILASYARHLSTQATDSTILKDIAPNHISTHINTLASYLNALRRLFVIDEVLPWSPKLRSKTTIRRSNTRHFTDPAIAAYFLGASVHDLMYDFNTFGLLFESLVIRDLRIYAQSLGGRIYHYRDKTGLEADAVIKLSDGRWAAIEVKLSSRMIDDAAENLLALAEKVDVESMKSPSFLMILTATPYAYCREDGVYVVPLGCLRP